MKTLIVFLNPGGSIISIEDRIWSCTVSLGLNLHNFFGVSDSSLPIRGQISELINAWTFIVCEPSQSGQSRPRAEWPSEECDVPSCCHEMLFSFFLKRYWTKYSPGLETINHVHASTLLLFFRGLLCRKMAFIDNCNLRHCWGVIKWTAGPLGLQNKHTMHSTHPHPQWNHLWRRVKEMSY